MHKKACGFVITSCYNSNKCAQQGSIHTMLQSISSALCTVNGELCCDDQPLVTGEKHGKSSHSNSKSTQTFKIDIFTEEVYIPVQSNSSQLYDYNYVIVFTYCIT